MKFAFLTLNQANKAPFSSFMCLPNNFVLSVSPERFIHLADNKIETRPIKGTLPRKVPPQKMMNKRYCSKAHVKIAQKI